jgi:lipoprotein signal peptidase
VIQPNLQRCFSALFDDGEMRTADTANTTTSALLPAVLWGVVLIGVDQLTKFAASGGGCGAVICPLRNDVLMLGVGGGTTVNVVGAGLAGLAIFVAWIRAANRRHHVPVTSAALVVAGIVANLIDRVLFGSVRDFLAVPGNAVINIADIGVVGGLAACSISMLTSRRLPANQDLERR